MILFTPIIITFVMINSEPDAQNTWIRWAILGIIWLVSLALIVWGEIEIAKTEKEKRK